MRQKSISIVIVLCTTMLVHFSAFTDESDDEQDSDSSRQYSVLRYYFFPALNNAYLGVQHGCVQFLVSASITVPLSLILGVNDDSYDGEEISLDVAIFGAVVEELIFHCALQPFLTRRINRVLSSVCCCNREVTSLVSSELANYVTSGLFGALHLTNPTPTLFQLVDCTIGCFYAGRFFNQHGRISVIMYHVAFNSLGVLLFYTFKRFGRSGST